MRAFNQSGAIVATSTVTIGPGSPDVPVNTPIEVGSAATNIRRVAVAFGGNFNTNGLVLDDLEFDRAGRPPPCLASGPPDLELFQPEPNLETQVNNFLLAGNVVTSAELDAATLVVTGSGAPKTLNLSGLVKPTGGNFGPTNITGMLSPGINQITVTVRNCRGADEAQRQLYYLPFADNTAFKILGFEVTQSIQNRFNTIRLIANKKTFIRVFVRVTGDSSEIQNVSAKLSGHRRSNAPTILGGPIAPGLFGSYGHPSIR